MRNSLLFFVILICCVSCKQEIDTWKGDYFGEKNDTDTLQIFAEGMVSNGMYNRDIVFSADGKEAYWGNFVNGIATILYSKQVDGKWSNPEIAPFASDTEFFYLEPALSPDSKKIFFLSTKNPPGKEPLPGWQHQNIWCSEKNEDGEWSEAYMLPEPINTEENNYFPSMSSNGNLYFTRVPKRSRDTKLYMAEFKDGKFLEPKILPEEINGIGNPYNAFISPDEKVLISCIGNHPESAKGDADYIMFKKDKNGQWQEGELLNANINLKGKHAISTSISPDGEYAFFANEINEKMKNYKIESFKERFKSAKNGNSSIYWIKLKKILN